VTIFLLVHPFDFVQRFISNTDHEVFSVLHRYNVLNIEKELIAH